MTEIVPQQLRRRRDAALRLPPLESNERDPIRKTTEPTMNAATILQIALYGGALTQEQYRHAWDHAPHDDARKMLHAYGIAHHAGWAA